MSAERCETSAARSRVRRARAEHLDDAIRVLTRVKYGALAVPKRMVLQNGGHGVYTRDISIDEILRWMDRWLKDVPNGVDREPPVQIWWETTDGPFGPSSPARPAKTSWRTAHSAWPAAETTYRTFYLAPDGVLSAAIPEAGSRRYLYPVGTELAGNNAQFALEPAPNGHLAYRTLPAAEDWAILGGSILTLHVTSEQPDTDFLVTLHDVAPDGQTLFLQRAYLRASMRASDQARATPQEVFHPYTERHEVTPGEPFEIQIGIPPIGHLLRQGHALELMILAPSTIPNPTWSPLPLDLPGFNTVHQGPAQLSRLVVPVVPGPRDAALPPPPSCGSVENQPCRKATPLSGVSPR